jgi:pimeloyl-ACP methyl ester carboxylesterase
MFAIDEGSGGPPVVFLHGGGPGGDSWIDFSPVLPYFKDRRAIFLDLLQYGGSSKNPFPPDELSWSYHARHIVGAMDALGVDKADFVCSSIGGSAALATAAMYPERVRRVVLSGSQPTIDVPGSLPEASGIGAKWVTPYYADEGPTWEKAQKLMAALEWYDASKMPTSRVDARLAGSMKLLELQATPERSRTHSRNQTGAEAV